MSRLLIPLAATLAVSIASPAQNASTGGRAVPKPGDRGIVRTVLSGHRIVEIPLEFLGTHEDAVGPGRDLYLVRLEGEDAGRVGVAAGMSGSPVYVNGELAGALSYRIGFLPQEPVAGVTPIGDVLDASRTPSAPSQTSAVSGLEPIATPVFSSGLAGPVRELLAAELEARGCVLVAGGRGSDDSASGPLEPGSPVGVQLVRGDLNMAATGTVTWVDGDRVYAFGHSFLGSGRVELPMVRAEVVHTLAALGGSVKLSNLGAEVGVILEDRLTAVVGRTGAEARTLPVQLAATGADLGRRRFDFEIVRHRRLTPLLTGVSVANALMLSLGYDDEATVRVTGRIRLEGLPDLPVELSASSGRGPHPFIGLAQRVQQVLGGLYDNPFDEPEVARVELTVDVTRDRRRYTIESLQYDRRPLRPGDVLTVRVMLRGYRGDETVRTLRLPVPDGLDTPAALGLAVGSPGEVGRLLGNPLARRLRTAQDLEDYVRVLAEARSADHLEAVLFRTATGAITGGSVYPALPPTLAHLLASEGAGRGARATRVAPLARVAERLDGPVEGGELVRIMIDGAADTGPEEEESR